MGRPRPRPSAPSSERGAPSAAAGQLGTAATAGGVDVASDRRSREWVACIYPFGYSPFMKPVQFLGDSLKRLREFPEDARQDAGYQLEKVQRGEQPDDFKPMPAIGKGVEELRIWDESGTYRVIYTARLKDCVAVLHAFQKKTQATSPRDVELARTRWIGLSKER